MATPEAARDPIPVAVVPLACPECRTELEPSGRGGRCRSCGVTYATSDGIWRLVASGRSETVEAFTHRYEAVRRREGWGSEDPAYYRALPFRDLSGRFTTTWRIRAGSYRTLIRRVVRPLEARLGCPLVVLDLGAGNGWLAHRLAERGHRVAAVDLSTDERDGLGARRRYDGAYVPVHGDFDALPFPPGTADLVIFNASLHYSADARRTLAEARRVSAARGLIAVVDTPVYHAASAGARMVLERNGVLLHDHGIAPGDRAAEGFLTFARLRRLGASVGLRWRILHPLPWWSMRAHALAARLAGRRETATMPLIVGRHAPVPPLLARTPGFAGRLWRRWLVLRFELFQRHRHDRLVLEHVGGLPIVVLPQVFNPVLFRTGEFLASTLDGAMVRQGAAVLDMGTGSGAAAVTAARLGARVVAVDVNPHAARCVRINALLNGVEDRVDVREGDLFAPVGDALFDLVLFNPPYFRGVPRNELERAWRATDAVERFAAALPAHLAPHGSALVLLSTDGDTPAFLEAFRAAGLQIDVHARRNLINEVLTVYRLTGRARA